MKNNIRMFFGKEVALEYLLTGEEHKETIMFVHGAGSNLRQFIAQHQYLSGNYKVLSVSLRGHGQSCLPTPNCAESYTLQKCRDDLVELIEGLQLRNINYVGNSAGGVIGLLLVEKRQDLFKSLITFGTTAEMKLSPFLTGLIAGIDKLMIKLAPDGYLRFTARHTSKDRESQRAIFELFKEAQQAIPYFRANLGSYSCTKIIETMDIPYLLVKSGDDTEINRMLASTLAAIASNSKATITTLKQAGHMGNLDQPEAFSQIIVKFINDIEVSVRNKGSATHENP